MENLKILNLNFPLAVVCHDAGAANHIVAWLKTLNTLDSIRAYMVGPANKIWQDNFPSERLKNSCAEALEGSTSLLSGTGWASDIEHEARLLAKKAQIKSIAMVDHWVNYPARFVRDGEQILPDEIWVVDEYAYRHATEVFPFTNVRLKPDRYSELLIESIKPINEASNHELLYILEPIRSDWGQEEQGEFQALDYFLGRIPDLNFPINLVVKLRPHPSDPPNKYERYLANGGSYKIVIDNGDLGDAISGAKWVAGCQSFALILALKAKRTVFCTLPPWAPVCRLPHSGIIHIKD